MNWLVLYYNGRSQREKFFNTRDEAIAFKNKCEDNKASIWRLYDES